MATKLQYSCWENSMDRGAWWATVYGVTRLSSFPFTFHFHALEKEMSPRPEQPLGRGSALSRLGAELELRRSGSSLPKSFCPELSSAFCPPAHWASSQPFLLDQGPSVAAFPLPFRLGCPSHVADSIQAFERNMSLQTGSHGWRSLVGCSPWGC